MSALEVSDIARRLRQFNIRAERELIRERQQRGLQVFIATEHPRLFGVASNTSAAAATYAVSRAKKDLHSSGGLPTNMRSLQTTLLVIGSVLAYHSTLLLGSEENSPSRVEIVKNVCLDITAALTALGLASVTIEKLSVTLSSFMQEVTMANANRMGAGFLQVSPLSQDDNTVRGLMRRWPNVTPVFPFSI